MKIKKYLRSGLAILCCISLTLGMVGFLPQTVSANESNSVTPPTFEEITFEDFGIDNGTYGYTPWIAPNGTHYRSPAAEGNYVGGLQNKTFVGKVNFSSTSRTCLIFGTKPEEPLGFSFGTWTDGALSYWDQAWSFNTVALSGEAQAGAIGQLETIKISFEVFDNDTDGADDVRIWLYFGDVLYNDAPLCVLTDYADQLGTYMGIVTYEHCDDSTVTVESVTEPEPVAPTAPEFDEITFEDFGIDNGTYGYTPWIAPNGTHYRTPAAEGYYAGGLKNKTFVGKVNFSSASRTCLIFGTKPEEPLGFSLGTWSDGALSYWDQAWSFNPVALSGDAQAGAIGELETIKISFEVFDNDTDGADDVRIWLYFGDVLYNDAPLCVLTDYADQLGTYMGIVTYEHCDDSTVTVESVVEPDPSAPIAPEFDEITFGDFGIDNGTYGYTPWIAPNGTHYRTPAAEGYYAGGLKNKTFVGKVNFSSASRTCLIFGTKPEEPLGFSLGTWDDGALAYWDQAWSFSRGSISGDAPAGAIGQLETVKISFEVFDNDTDGADDVRIWLYFGDVLYNDAPLCVLTDYADQLGTYMGIVTYEHCDDSTVTVESVGETGGENPGPGLGPGPGTEPDPITPPTFEEVTFSDFGLESGIYTGKEDLIADKTYAGGLANKTFVGKVNFSEKSRTSINLGGSSSGWEGVALGTWTDGRLWFWDNLWTFDPIAIPVEATTAVGEGQTIKLSFEVTDIDDDGADDVRFWLYFGDVLYNNAPIYAAKDYAQYLGSHIGIRCYNADSSVIIASKDEGSGPATTPVEPAFEEYTFSDFKVDNGTYGYVDGEALAVDKKYKETLLNKSFAGNITFPTADGASLYLGGNAANQGVQFTTADGKLYFAEAEDKFVAVALDETVVEGGLRGQNVKYKVAFEYADTDNDGLKDDVRFWLYVNDKLYNNGPIVEATNYVTSVGSYMGIFSDNMDASVVVSSIEIVRPIIVEPKLPEITFSDFEIEDGTYSKEPHNGCSASGFYREGFANKTFIGTVNFNGNPLASIQFGGTDSEWKGVRLMVLSDGNLYFMESEGLFDNIKLSGEVAGTKLVGADVKVKLTVEVTDIDGDGKQDDVRYWLSFNDILYNDEPIKEAIDYAHKVGGRMGIYASDDAAKITVKSAKLNRPVVKADFSIMGFSDNWEKEIAGKNSGTTSSVPGSDSPYIGDSTPITFYIIICAAALAGAGAWYYNKKRRNVTK